eukprot:COSAG06_NODE_834_length_11974_cov_5.664739_3_plen_81_part_00
MSVSRTFRLPAAQLVHRRRLGVLASVAQLTTHSVLHMVMAAKSEGSRAALIVLAEGVNLHLLRAVASGGRGGAEPPHLQL